MLQHASGCSIIDTLGIKEIQLCSERYNSYKSQLMELRMLEDNRKTYEHRKSKKYSKRYKKLVRNTKDEED